MSNRLLFFLIISTSFLFLAAASPVFLHESLAQWLGSWQKMMFSGICHQQLARTIHLEGIPAAVCSRCLGIYAFLSIGFLWVPVFKRFLIKDFQYSKVLLILATSILLMDFGLQWIGLYEGTNLTRFLSGSAVGLSTAIFIIYYK